MKTIPVLICTCKKSHNGTDFCPSGPVWLVLGTILTKRIVKVNAVKETRRKNKEELTFGGNLHKLSIRVNGS